MITVRFQKRAVTKIELILLVLASLFLLKAGAAISQEKEGGQEAFSAAQLARAKATFNEKCARCHGANGRGETVLGEMLQPPDFTDEKWSKSNGDDDELVACNS